MSSKTVLVIDDDLTTRETLEDIISRMGYKTQLAKSGEEGLKILLDSEIDLVLVDMILPNMNGLEFVEKAYTEKPDVPLVVITGQPSTPSTVDAIKKGAQDYVVKPLDLTRMRTIITNSLKMRSLELANRELQEQIYGKTALDSMIGTGSEMKSIFEMIKQVAPTDATVLVTGESGTGKELVANALHALSKRNQGPFLKLNSAAFPKDLLESELFGHEKGAFTGALRQKKGKFELSDGGTLFLDEIGDMPLEIQAKLLRVLEEQSFMRVGGVENVKVDVRIITATNADLHKLIKNGNFREDLYYRINVVEINMPPLRNKKEDIPLMVDRFLVEYSRKQGVKKDFSKEAIDVLCEYDWPGNIRELRNIVERSIITCASNVVEPKDLPRQVVQNENSFGGASMATGGKTMEEIEKMAIIDVLNNFEGNKSKAAKALGIGLKTLYRKIEKYNIES